MRLMGRNMITKKIDINKRLGTLVEREALLRVFSSGSTLNPGLKAFRRRGPKCSLYPAPLSPGSYYQL
jgi:hypothetical protein